MKFSKSKGGVRNDPALCPPGGRPIPAMILTFSPKFKTFSTGNGNIAARQKPT